MKRGAAPPRDAALDEFTAMRREVAEAAVDVADVLVDAAVRKLDAVFGAGHAKAHPELVAAYLAASSAIFRDDFALAADLEGFDADDLDLPPPDLDRRR